MFVLAKRNIVIPKKGGGSQVRLRRGELALLPEWAEKSSYVSALIADKKLVVSGKDDKSLQSAAEKPTKVRRGRTETEE